MERCTECGSRRLDAGTYEATRVVAGRTYSAELAGFRCRDCRRTYFAGPGLARCELAIAVHLTVHGPVCGEALTWARIALGMSGQELAGLLGVRAETLSRWENDRSPIDPKAWVLVGCLAAEKYDRRGDMLQRLRSLAKPRVGARRVRLNLRVPA